MDGTGDRCAGVYSEYHVTLA
eukprot:SAG31_NODE_21041_length_559_cov_0.893478_1_plen_20_part_10